MGQGGTALQTRLYDLPRGFVVVGVLVLIGARLLLTMLYTVGTDAVAVVQRFGTYVRREEPGLRTKLPLGLETVRKVKVQCVLKAEFGFRADEPGARTRGGQRSFHEESLMLTEVI
jgi:membrane protease subunit HflK